jgi:hypothetical protein
MERSRELGFLRLVLCKVYFFFLLRLHLSGVMARADKLDLLPLPFNWHSGLLSIRPDLDSDGVGRGLPAPRLCAHPCGEGLF